MIGRRALPRCGLRNRACVLVSAIRGLRYGAHVPGSAITAPPIVAYMIVGVCPVLPLRLVR